MIITELINDESSIEMNTVHSTTWAINQYQIQLTIPYLFIIYSGNL